MALLIAGCTSLSKLPEKTTQWWAREAPGTPSAVVAVWSYAVGQFPDRPPLRGFGARLMFYEEHSPRPIKVDGNLVVYAYEESSTSTPRIAADRKYLFTQEELARCYSQTPLGHSYSIWVPWDELGGPQREVSLIVCFTPIKGPTVVSPQTKIVLPGTTPASEAVAATVDPARATDTPQPKVWTTPLPRGWQHAANSHTEPFGTPPARSRTDTAVNGSNPPGFKSERLEQATTQTHTLGTANPQPSRGPMRQMFTATFSLSPQTSQLMARSNQRTSSLHSSHPSASSEDLSSPPATKTP